MSLRDRATAGVAWSAVHTWGTYALQLGLMLVLARVLTAREFGVFALAQVVLALVQPFAEQGIPDALVQADRDDQEYWSTGFAVVLAGSLAAAALLFLSAALVAGVFRAPGVAPVLRGVAPAVVISGIHDMWFARIRAGLAFDSFAFAGVSGAVASFIFAVVTALLGGGVWALVAGLYAGLVVETVLLVRMTGWLPGVRIYRLPYARLVRFGWLIVAGDVTTFLNRRSDDFFVGLFLGAPMLGYYNIAYRLLELVTTMFLRAVERVVFPVLAKLQRTPELMADAMRTSFRFTSLSSFPAFAAVALLAPELVRVALGESWTPSVAPLRILSIAGFALAAVNVLPTAIRAAGQPQWNVAISATKGVLLAGAFAVAAHWNLAAVAWVFTAGMYISIPAFLLAARRLIPLSPRQYLGEATRPLLATAIMTAAVLAAATILPLRAPFARLSVEAVTAVASYALAAAFVARDQLQELRQRLKTFAQVRVAAEHGTTQP